LISLPGGYMYKITVGDGLKIPESKLEGTPYLWDSYKSGKLLLKENKLIKNFEFNYNVYNNRIEFKKNGELMAIDDPSKIDMIVYDQNKVLEYKKYRNKKNSTKAAFMRLLVDGKVKLYKKFECQLLEPNYNEALMVGDKDYQLKHGHSFYMQKDEGVLNKIKVRKRKILKYLGDKKNEVRQFIKENNLDVDKEYDLQKIFIFYNNLGK